MDNHHAPPPIQVHVHYHNADTDEIERNLLAISKALHRLTDLVEQLMQDGEDKDAIKDLTQQVVANTAELAAALPKQTT